MGQNLDCNKTPIRNLMKQYFYSIDALRVIAITAVLLIHSSIKPLSFEQFPIDRMWLALFLNQIAGFAVPMFFIISGFVLELTYKEKLSFTKFFMKRTKRVLIPYIFWSALYFSLFSHKGVQVLFSKGFFDSILYGGASYQLYFIPTLLLFYLAFPFLHSIIKLISNKWIFITLVALQFFFLYQDFYVHTYDIRLPLRIALLSFLPFLLGMVVSHNKNYLFKLGQRFSGFASLALFILIPSAYVYLFVSLKNTHNLTYLYSQFNPINYMYTFLLTVVLFQFFEKVIKKKGIFSYLSSLSFFVFFIHVWIQTLFWDFGVMTIKQQNPELLYQWWFVPFFFGTTVCVSFGIAAIAHKIPYVSKVAG